VGCSKQHTGSWGALTPASPQQRRQGNPTTPPPPASTNPQAIDQPGTRLIELPRSCHLTYDESSDPRVLSLIQQVPDELWGAKLALQVRCRCRGRCW
jgi:hypothetical protein